MRVGRQLRCVLFAIVLLTGCQSDEVGTYGFGNEDAGTDVPQAPDASEGWPDVEFPPEDREQPAIPSEPPEASACNEQGWCWLHPSPFPHHVVDIETAGEKVFGVADDDSMTIRGAQGFVWDGSSMTLVDNPIAPHAEWAELVATKRGWLGLTPAGKVYGFGPDEVFGTVELPSDGYASLSGLSIDEFVATGPDGVTVYSGGLEVATDPSPRPHEQFTKVWSDGTFWEVNDSDTKREIDNSWTMFPRPEYRRVKTMGPSPASQCAEEGIWAVAVATDGRKGAYKWDGSDKAWRPGPEILDGVSQFHCTDDGDLLALNGDSLLKKVGSEWIPLELGGHFYSVVDSDGSKVILGGSLGGWATISGGKLERHSRRFRLNPEDAFKNHLAPQHLDIWTNQTNSRLVLVHRDGVFSWQEGTWTRQERSTFGPTSWTGAYPVDMWGDGQGRFISGVDSLWEWKDEEWNRSLEATFAGSPDWGRADLAGTSSQNVWLFAPKAIFRFDGEAWEEISLPGTPVRQTIDENELFLREGMVKNDGTVLVSAGPDIFEIAGGPDFWDMKKVMSTPCPTIRGMHFAEDGQLYIASLDECIARKDADGWKTYKLPPTSQSPPWANAFSANEIIAQPGDRPPLVSTDFGIFAIEEDSLRREYLGEVRGFARIESKNAVFALQKAGVMAKYY